MSLSPAARAPLALHGSPAALQSSPRPPSDWFDANVYDPAQRRAEMAANPESPTARTQRYIRYLVGGALTLGVLQLIMYTYVRVQMMLRPDPLGPAPAPAPAAAVPVLDSADSADSAASAGAAAAPEVRRRVVPRFSLARPWEPVYVRAPEPLGGPGAAAVI